ncbi:MAG: transcription antitermination factor NusB [Burkholderiaceae bacterium]|jgi:N utilization substance protein B
MSEARPHVRNPRRRSRELAVQGLYQWLLNPVDAGVIDAHMRGAPGYEKADHAHYQSLLHGVIALGAELRTAVEPFLDRPWVELSPVEQGVLLMGAFELRQHPEIPYRVVINEAVELTKTFGGTDGFKYINGILDKVATVLRAEEVKPQAL